MHYIISDLISVKEYNYRYTSTTNSIKLQASFVKVYCKHPNYILLLQKVIFLQNKVYEKYCSTFPVSILFVLLEFISELLIDVLEYRDTRIHGYMDTGIHGYMDTGIQGYKKTGDTGDTGIQGYRDTRIQGY